MSTYSREAANWDSSGYGPIVSMTSVSPPSSSFLYFERILLLQMRRSICKCRDGSNYGTDQSTDRRGCRRILACWLLATPGEERRTSGERPLNRVPRRPHLQLLKTAWSANPPMPVSALLLQSLSMHGSSPMFAEPGRRKYCELPWLAVCCTYVRDREGGQVVLGPDGLPRVHYWPSPHDQKSILNVQPPPTHHLPELLFCVVFGMNARECAFEGGSSRLPSNGDAAPDLWHVCFGNRA